MQRLIFLLTVLVLLGKTVSVSAQEEFFGNQSGFTFSYSNGLNAEDRSAGASLYLKNKMIIGINTLKIDNLTYPFFMLMACPRWGSEVQPLKLGYGLTYGFVEDNHIIGFNLLMAKPYFTTSNFPFSIQGTVTILTTLSKNGNNEFVLYPGVGLGYVQALFANHQVYPVAGVSYSVDMYTKSDLFTAHLGINIKINNAASKN